MVQAKLDLFEKELSKSANYFKVLAHPARLQILQFLAQSKTCITGDISDELPLSRTTVIQHIKELKEVGLIVGQIEGVKTKYCLKPEKVREVSENLAVFFESISCKNYQCK